MASYATFYVLMARASAGLHRAPAVRFNFLLVFWPLLLAAETAVYGAARKKQYPPAHAWFHIIAMAVAFVLMPLFFLLVTFYLRFGDNVKQSLAFIGKLEQVRVFVFWLLFITGHAFFIATIVKIFRRKKSITTENEPAPGLLDDIIDED
jgi:hypothetical protein